MTSPIDPIRRTARTRRSDRASVESQDDAPETFEDRSVPVVVGPPAAPEPERIVGSASIFAAQLMGQDGQKRGLRGGAPVLDAARSSYNQVEYSGAADRRARKGGAAKTDV